MRALAISLLARDPLRVGVPRPTAAPRGRPGPGASRTRPRARTGAGSDVYVAVVPDGTAAADRRLAGRDDFGPAWSPNGKQIAYRLNPASSDESDIMVVAAGGGTPRNLTKSPGVADWSPAWSPDGRSIAFFSMRAGGRDIWVMRPDGTASGASPATAR